MELLRRTSFSRLSDQSCQISARIKFEIKKSEAHCHWIMCVENDLTAEHLAPLIAIYNTLAQYYERLLQIDLSKRTVKTRFAPLPHSRSLGGVSKSTLLEFFKVIQEAQREIIMTNTRSDKVNFMVRMSDLYREFSALLEQHLKSDESTELNSVCSDLPIFSVKEKSVLNKAHNHKLESLFRVLEK